MEFLYLSVRGGNLSLSKSSEIVILGFEKINNYFLIYFSRSSFCIFSSPGEKAKFILPKGLYVDSSCTQILSAAHHVQLVWKPQKKLYNANPENAGMMIHSSRRVDIVSLLLVPSDQKHHAIVNAEHHPK